MNSIEKTSELLAKKSEIQGGSNAKKSGEFTARERINALLDEGTFVEFGGFVSARDTRTNADGVITGYGLIDGRMVYVYSQDEAVLCGAIGERNADKVCKIFDMAVKMGAPIIGILDSNGVRLNEGASAQAAMGKILNAAAQVSGIVPNISIVMGNCAGGSAVAAQMSDFVIINEKKGRLFVNGPAVVEAATGKKQASAQECGNAHLAGKNEGECLALARLLLSYLPSNNLSDAFEFETADDLNRTSELLSNLDEVADVRVIASEIADDKAYFELGDKFGTEASTGFIRVNGSVVGIVATNGEELGCDAVTKAARFVRFCDCFNLPVVTLTDVDGFKVSLCEENCGLARKAATLTYAFAAATTAKVNIIVKKSYGTTGVILNSKMTGADVVYAYPVAEIAPLDAKAGVGMLYNDRLKKGESRETLMEEYREKTASVYNAAACDFVDDIIDPAQSRGYIAAALEMLMSKRAKSPERKHDNMPL